MRTTLLIVFALTWLSAAHESVLLLSAGAQESTQKVAQEKTDPTASSERNEGKEATAESRTSAKNGSAKNGQGQSKPKGKSKSPEFDRTYHPWARFKPGAWRSHRVITETVDERGEVSGLSTTNTTQTLGDIGRTKYTIREESTHDVQHKLFLGPPRWVTSGFFEQGDAQSTQVSKAGEGAVTIEGRKLLCQKYKVVVSGKKKTRTIYLYFNRKVYPYILRREIAITDNGEKSPPVETIEQVIALDMPFRVLSEIVLTSHVRSERKGSKGTTVQLSIHSRRVPGGVVAYWTKELDSEGRMIRRTMLELTDYDLEPVARVRRRRRNKRSELEDESERVSDGRGKDRRGEDRKSDAAEIVKSRK